MIFMRRLLARVLLLLPWLVFHQRAVAAAGTLGPVEMEAYTQTVVITFHSEAAAQQARVRLTGLYHDFQAAFSTRMDDCNVNGLRVAEVMARFGQKGTFMLNDPARWWQDSAETGITTPDDPARELPRRLLAGGNSLGGHSFSHEIMPALSKNRAFWEILRARIALETASRSPNVVFAFPFIRFRSPLRDGVDRADLDEMLRRSGYYHLAEDDYNESWDSEMIDGQFVALDANPAAERTGEARLQRGAIGAERPLFLVTMHAWVNAWGGPNFPKLAEIYRKWSGRSDWWYCNLNEYAAYRYQAAHARLATSVRGNVLRAVLVRPDPRDLGDPIPLTFRIDGVKTDDVASVTCDTAETAAAKLDGGYAFDLFHDRARGAIDLCVESANSTNAAARAADVPPSEGLQAFLHRDGRVLKLAMTNAGPAVLRDIRVCFRLPLRWEQGVVRRRVASLNPGETTALEISLTEREDAPHYREGVEYNVAQIDFRAERAVRLYATCELPAEDPADFFVRRGFRVLGPLAGDRNDFDPVQFAQPFLNGAPAAASHPVPWGGTVNWRIVDPAKTAILDSDIIPVSWKPNIPANYRYDPPAYFPHTRAHYLLHGRIVSPNDRVVTAIFSSPCVRWLSVNGARTTGDQLALKQGVNDIRILYRPSTDTESAFDEANYGCYFRLVDAAGQRVTDVRFEPPPMP